MTDLGFIAYYLEIEVTCTNNLIIVIQIVYIDQLLASYQMTNYNIATTIMVKKLYLLPAINNFIPKDANITTYKRFTRNAQWLAYQSQPNII